MPSPGQRLRETVARQAITCFIGVFDCFSARLAGNQFDGLFLSGFGFAASHYGLPDTGFVTWTDMLAFLQRVRAILPDHHVLVDVDDGFGGPEQAAHVAVQAERGGASAIVMEDQKRPRKCGHLDGQQVLDLDEYLAKLRAVLEARCELFVVARTDASDEAERLRRALAFQDAGADAVLMDGMSDLAQVKRIASRLAVPVMFNQMAGGKSPPCTLTQLVDAGVRLVNYSAPCLLPAQAAMQQALLTLRQRDGLLPQKGDEGFVGVRDCDALLRQNMGTVPPRWGEPCAEAQVK